MTDLERMRRLDGLARIDSWCTRCLGHQWEAELPFWLAVAVVVAWVLGGSR